MTFKKFGKSMHKFLRWHEKNPIYATFLDSGIALSAGGVVSAIIYSQQNSINNENLLNATGLYEASLKLKNEGLQDVVIRRQSEIYLQTAARFQVAYILNVLKQDLGIDLTTSSLANTTDVEKLFVSIPFDKVANKTVLDLVNAMADFELIEAAAHQAGSEAAQDLDLIRSYRSIVEDPIIYELMSVALNKSTQRPDFKRFLELVPPLRIPDPIILSQSVANEPSCPFSGPGNYTCSNPEYDDYEGSSQKQEEFDGLSSIDDDTDWGKIFALE